MKKVVLLCLLFLSGQAFTQTGSSRQEAIPVTPQNLCSYSDQTTQGLETWYKFTAQSEKVAIELKSEKFGNNQAHVHHVKLYKGMETEEVNHDELPFNAESHKLKINLNAGNLVVGETYYIKAERKPHYDDCNKNNCKENDFANPAQFKLCVENVGMYIPNDFNNENSISGAGFELHRGQVDNMNGGVANEVLAYSKNTFPQVYLTDRTTSLLWSRIDNDSTTVDSLERVDLNLVGSFMSERIFYQEELPGVSNYYLPVNPKGIVQNKSYSRIIRQGVYNGIDWHFYSNQKGLKMYFVVDAGVSSNLIRFNFSPNAQVELTLDGGMKIRSIMGDIKFKKAIVYNINPSGNNVPMPQSGTIINLGNGEYGFEISDNFPSNRKLVIQIERDTEEPVRGENNPEWCTYVGGSNTDYFTCIDASADGRFTLAAGATYSDIYPTEGANIFSSDRIGFSDGVITCFNPNHSMKYSTYLGGAGHDIIFDIDFDDQFQVAYISGLSGSANNLDNFHAKPLASNPNCFQKSFDGTNEPISPPYKRSFFSRIDLDGNITWNTAFALNMNYERTFIQVDATGNLFFGGNSLYELYAQPTCDGSFTSIVPKCNTLPNSYQGALDAPTVPYGDCYVGKFDRNMNLVWSSSLMGINGEFINDIAVDNQNGKLYVVGARSGIGNTSEICDQTGSGLILPTCNPENYSFFDKTLNGDAPPSNGDFYPENPHYYDGFIMQFGLNGELLYSTMIGGELEDVLMEVEVDQAGNIYVVGMSESDENIFSCVAPTGGELPMCNPSLANPFGGYDSESLGKIYVAKFSPNFDLLYASFLSQYPHDFIDFDYFYDNQAYVNLNPFYPGEEFPSLSVNPDGDFYIYSPSAADDFPTLSNPGYYNQNAHADYYINGPSDLNTDHIIAHYNADLEMNWSSYFGGRSTEKTNEFGGEIKAIGNKLYICGGTKSIEYFPYFSPGGLAYNQTANGIGANNSDAFIAQLIIDPFYLDVKEIQEKKNLAIVPNPTKEIVEINFDSPISANDEVLIYNQVGQLILRQELKTQAGKNTTQVNVASLSTGIYFVSLKNNSGYATTKLVKL